MNSDEFILEVPVELPVRKRRNTTRYNNRYKVEAEQMSLRGSVVFHTGTFVYLHETEPVKNRHLQNMHKKKK